MKNSGSHRIAERYVKALFDVAQAAGALTPVEADMRALDAACAGSVEFQEFLANPLLSQDIRAKGMLQILARLQAHQVTSQFIGMLIRQKRLRLLPQVAALFQEWAARARGEVKGSVTAARPLTPGDMEAISARLSKSLGKKIALDARANPDLLGGVVVNIGSLRLDASLAGKLHRLGEILRAA